MKHPTIAACAAGLFVTMAVASAAAAQMPLERFYAENAGKTVNRVPVLVLPENSFQGAGNDEIVEPGYKTLLTTARKTFEAATWNVVTLTLRCKPDLSDPVVVDFVKAYVKEAHDYGVKVCMDVDPRIARREFLRRWPADIQRVARFATSAVRDGQAAVTLDYPAYEDHMSWGSARPYEATDARLIKAWALTPDSAGRMTAVREVRAKAEKRAASGKTPAQIVVSCDGLKEGEMFVAHTEFDLFSCDVFSPNLIPFERELLERYKGYGVDGGMRDEWGFPPTNGRDFEKHLAFWTSPNFEAAYAKRMNGRRMSDDFLVMAFDIVGREAERKAAIDAYMRLTYERNREIEQDFYATDKRLFGPDVYVCKHPTWYSVIGLHEFYHNGLDWWAATRDWAQGDETTPLPALCGMAKKFGGANWMNEGYQGRPQNYAPLAWRYALVGGRMVYHPVFPAKEAYDKIAPGISPLERHWRKHVDMLEMGVADAQSRIRLINLVSDAQPDCPAAVVFGHARVVNWSDSAFSDWGYPIAYGIWNRGYGADVYPSSEFEGSTFSVDADGFLRVGRQAYKAVVLTHLSAADIANFRRIVGSARLKTTVFVNDTEGVPSATKLSDADAGNVADFLDGIGAVRQTPVWTRGRLPKEMDYEILMPAHADGVLALLDGTRVRIKAVGNKAGGDPIEGTLDLGSGVKVSFAATGVFAARADAKGHLVAVAGGALKSVSAADFKLTLDKPEDIALVKLADGWHGVWQTKQPGEIPAALKPLAVKWTTLVRP